MRAFGHVGDILEDHHIIRVFDAAEHSPIRDTRGEAGFNGRRVAIRIVTFEMLWGERRGQWHHRRSSESMERPMPQLNDLSRSLVSLEQDATLSAVIEMGQSSWLVASIVPGVERQALKKLGVDEGAPIMAARASKGNLARPFERCRRCPYSPSGSPIRARDRSNASPGPARRH